MLNSTADRGKSKTASIFTSRQASLDGLLHRREELTSTIGHRTAKVWWENGHFYRHEPSEQELQDAIQEITDDINWIKKNCVVVPAIEGKQLTDNQREVLAFLGRETTDALLAANSTSALFLCDDMALRQLGAELFDIKGVWLQPALLMAVEKGIVSLDDYVGAVANLIEAKHYFISVDRKILAAAWRRGRWITSRESGLLTHALTAPDVEIRGAVNIATALLVEAWNELPRLDSERLTFHFLEQILQHTGAQNVTKYITGVSVVLTRLGASRAADIIGALRMWCDGHFLPWPFAKA